MSGRHVLIVVVDQIPISHFVRKESLSRSLSLSWTLTCYDAKNQEKSTSLANLLEALERHAPTKSAKRTSLLAFSNNLQPFWSQIDFAPKKSLKPAVATFFPSKDTAIKESIPFCVPFIKFNAYGKFRQRGGPSRTGHFFGP